MINNSEDSIVKHGVYPSQNEEVQAQISIISWTFIYTKLNSNRHEGQYFFLKTHKQRTGWVMEDWQTEIKQKHSFAQTKEQSEILHHCN